jgi:High potential iron-sulfur protein
MKTSELTRRNFLFKLTAASGATLGMAGILTGCGGGEEAPAEKMADMDEMAAPMAAEGCMDVSGITSAEADMRNTLGYVDVSTEDGKTCDNCALFLAADGMAACGGCTLLKGPIAAGGYCMSWAMAQS